MFRMRCASVALRQPCALSRKPDRPAAGAGNPDADDPALSVWRQEDWKTRGFARDAYAPQ